MGHYIHKFKGALLMKLALYMKRVVSGVSGLSLIPMLDLMNNAPVTLMSLLGRLIITVLMLYLITVSIVGTWHVFTHNRNLAIVITKFATKITVMV